MTASPFMPDVRVEVAFDSGVLTPAADRNWQDISSYVELSDDSEIIITRGRPSELDDTSPSLLSLSVDNRDGRFTPGLSSGAYYPNVKLGRPIRVCAMPDTTAVGNFLAVDQATFEDTDSVADYWVAGGSNPPTLTRSTVRDVDGVASMLITWASGGTFPQAQTTVTGLTVGRTYTASAYGYVPTGDPSVQLVIAGGSAGSAMSTKNAFTRFSLTFTATASTHLLQVWPTTSPSASDQCWIDNVQVWEGSSTVTFTTTLAEDVISTRFTGYVDEWPLEWNGSDDEVLSQITASSRLARLGDGAELRSVIEAEILADDPIAYYPLFESTAADHAVDLTGNDLVGMYSYYGGGGIGFGGGVGPGTDGHPAVTIFPHVEGETQNALGAYFDHSMSEVTMECFAVLPRTGANVNDYVPVMTLHQGVGGGDYQILSITALNPGSGSVVAADARHEQSIDGVVGYISSQDVFADIDNALNVLGTLFTDSVRHFACTYVPGATPEIKFYIDGELFSSSTTEFGAGVPSTMPDFGLLLLGPMLVDSGNEPMTIAHAAVFDTVLSAERIAAHAAAGLSGAIGELAAERIERYANYAGVEADEIDSDPGIVPLAHIDTTDKTVDQLLRIIEATENGVLYDARDGKLAFRDRQHRYDVASAFTLDVSLQEVEASGLRPILDRANLINSVTARAVDGSAEQRFEDATAIEEYGPKRVDLELAAADNDQLYQSAAWRVTKYKDPKPRIAALAPVDVLPLGSSLKASIIDADISTRFTVDNLPSQAPATSLDFFIEGVTETIGVESWRFEFNVSAAEIYDDIWILGDANRSQLGETTILAL